MDLTVRVEHVLRYAEPVLIVLLVSRVMWARIWRLYKAFTVFLLLWLLQDTVPLVLNLDVDSPVYGQFFFISEPFAWLLACLVLLELFDLTLADYRGIRSAGRLCLSAGVILAVVSAMITALPTLLRSSGNETTVRFYSVIERSVMVITLVLLAALLFGSSLVTGNLVATAVDLGCLTYWIVNLNQQGHNPPSRPQTTLSETQSISMREHLTDVNYLMERLEVQAKAKRSRAWSTFTSCCRSKVCLQVWITRTPDRPLYAGITLNELTRPNLNLAAPEAE
jgi:hypothetical protein